MQTWLNEQAKTHSETLVLHSKFYLKFILAEAHQDPACLMRSSASKLASPRTKQIAKDVLTAEQFREVVAELKLPYNLMVRESPESWRVDSGHVFCGRGSNFQIGTHPAELRARELIRAALEGVTFHHQPISRIRSRMSALYLFMRSGRRFRGAGKIAASRAASSRPIFRAAVPS